MAEDKPLKDRDYSLDLFRPKYTPRPLAPYRNEYGIGHQGPPDPLDAYRPRIGGVPVRPAQW